MKFFLSIEIGKKPAPPKGAAAYYRWLWEQYNPRPRHIGLKLTLLAILALTIGLPLLAVWGAR